ncbi:hypothetical protein Efla_006880 [Eimeria flavescens]
MDTLDAPQIVNHSSVSLSYVPHACCWIPSSICCLAGGEAPKRTGELELYTLKEGQLKRKQRKEANAGVKCLSIAAAEAPQTNILLSGHFDGSLIAWDSEALDREVWRLKAHQSVLTAAEGHPNQPVVATGGREGTVKIWDLRCRQTVVSLEPAAGEEAAECWSVCWGGCTGGSLGSVCCGYDNGDVKLFDLKRMQLLAETNLDYGVCCLACDRRDIQLNKLLVAALEGRLFTGDLRTQHPEEGFAFKEQQLCKGTIWGVYPLPQNREIAAASCGSGTVSFRGLLAAATEVNRQ